MKRLSFLTAFTAALFISSPWAGARAAAQQKPAVQAPLATTVSIVDKTLENGLSVIVFEDHAVPLVTVELAVRNGSFTEPPELNGLSHLYEHMFFKSNRAKEEGAEYLKDINNLGIAYNGETREEVVQYYFSTITPNFPVAMRYIKDAVRYPSFDQREFEAEQQVVIGEINNNESNPYAYVQWEMNNNLFFKYPSRKNPLGNRDTVGKSTTDMMRTIQGRYYVPNNSALIVTGDVNPQVVFQLAQDLFKDWPRRTPDPFKEFPLVDHPPLIKSQGSIITKPVQNVVIMLGWHGPSIGKDDAATYAADVFSYIVGQPNSRFQRALVDAGLVTGVGLGYYTQRNIGPINVFAQTTTEKARQTVRVLYDEIAHFNDPNYYTDEELDASKSALEADDLFSREKPSDYVHTIAFWWSTTGLDYFRGYLGRLRATSRKDISHYLTTYILGKPHVGLALMSDDSLKASGLTAADLIGPSGSSKDDFQLRSADPRVAVKAGGR